MAERTEEAKNAVTQEKDLNQNTSRKKMMVYTTLCFAFVGVVFFLLWVFIFRIEETTKDAYVHGNIMELTPQVSGIVSGIYTEETNRVCKGQLLIEIDPTDFEIEYTSAQAALGESVRNVVQMFENVKMLRARLEVDRARLLQAELDFEHRLSLVESGAVSREEFQHAELKFEASRAQVRETEYNLAGALSLVRNTDVFNHPLVVSSKEKVRQAYINLNRCRVYAPTEGIIAKRRIQVGEVAAPNTPMLALIPLEELWVNANFKEVKLRKMRVGQPVKLRSDTYGGEIEYQGKLVGIGAGTGSAFATIPPQNATGNWIKIVQRVPVRVSLEPKQLEDFPLRVGLSMKATVDVSDQSGKRLPDVEPPKARYITNIYPEQEVGVECIIEKIVQDNITVNPS